MNTTIGKQPVGATPDEEAAARLHGKIISGRPVLDPMNRLDADEARLAETGTGNPYFGESDPGRLPHQQAMHVTKTRRWIVASSLVGIVNVVLGIVLIPISEAMAAGALALAILLYGMVWIFRMFLATDHRRTMLLASLVGLQMLLVIGVAVLLVFG